MVLPTCPSCGQSVLDDDATDCPFCGAAMDGSAGAKKKAPQSRPSPPEKPATAATKSSAGSDNEDPFAIAQNPSAAKAVQCARKPVKGRLHRVVCPMCDTQGFIPKAAIGRQVKCANKDCLVPIFTASESDEKPKARAPIRISDGESEKPKKASSGPAAAKSPVLMYSVVGGILLVLTLGLVWHLNKPGITELGPAVNIDFSNVDTEDDSTDPQATDATTKPPEKSAEVDHRKAALALIDEMIEASRVNGGNRDKAFCRRQTADAYLRLGMSQEAQAEFEQMKVVSDRSNDKNSFYKIGPVLTQYWSTLASKDSAAATAYLNEASALAQEIPTSIGLAQEAAVSLAAALIHNKQLDAATSLVAGHQRDQTLSAQQDTVRFGGWFASETVLRETNQKCLSPLEAFRWNEPLVTSVGLHLAARSQWESAIQWADAQQNPLTISDTFAVIAERMVIQNAPEPHKNALATAATSKGTNIALRTNAVLSRGRASDAFWNTATQQYQSLPEFNPVALGTALEVIEATAPETNESQLTAVAIADVVVAAISRNDSETANSALSKLTRLLMTDVPPTTEVRKAAGEVDADDDKIKAMIAEAYGTTDTGDGQVRRGFIAYRKSIDMYASVAEQRRLILLRLLSRIIENNGLAIVKAAIAGGDSLLASEVGVDELCHVLFVAAAGSDQSYPEIMNMNPDLTVPPGRVARTEPLEEQAVVPVLVRAWQAFEKSPDLSVINGFESLRELPGLRFAYACYFADKAAGRDSATAQLLNSSRSIRNELWREQCLNITTQLLARRVPSSELHKTANSLSLSPTQRVVTLHGIVLGTIAQATTSP